MFDCVFDELQDCVGIVFVVGCVNEEVKIDLLFVNLILGKKGYMFGFQFFNGYLQVIK